MPYIIAKRSDVTGTRRLQVLDLKPNASLANFPYRPAQQTKYIPPIDRPAASLATDGGGLTFFSQAASGLEAWFITNVDNGTPIQATGTITVGTPLAGDTITIGGTTLTGVGAARTSGSDDFNVTGGGATAAADIAAAINDGANSFTAIVTASAAGNVVTLTAVPVGDAGNSITLATSNPTELVLSGSTLEGGSDGSALTAAQATTNADDVLGLLAYDDLATAAGALTLAAVNGALTLGALTADQLTEMLDILSGRSYTVPAGVQVDDNGVFGLSPAVGAAGGPEFGPIRRITDLPLLRMSVEGGQLSKLLDSGFTWDGASGAQGEAVAVYNDDGSLF